MPACDPQHGCFPLFKGRRKTPKEGYLHLIPLFQSGRRWSGIVAVQMRLVKGPRNVRFGSFTTDAVEATRACMSAVARKQTSSRSSRYVRLVPQAVTGSPSLCL